MFQHYAKTSNDDTSIFGSTKQVIKTKNFKWFSLQVMLGAFPLVLPDFPLKAIKPSLDARKTNKGSKKEGLDVRRESLVVRQEGNAFIKASLTADTAKMGVMKEDVEVTNKGQEDSEIGEGLRKVGLNTMNIGLITRKVNKQNNDKSNK